MTQFGWFGVGAEMGGRVRHESRRIRSRRYYTLHCPECHVTFQTTKRRAKTCADCNRKANPPQPCARCGAMFLPWRTRAGALASHARKFCCAAPKRERVVQTRAPLAVRQCAYCSVSYTPKSNRARQICCGKACRARYQSRLRKLLRRGLKPFVIPLEVIYRRDRARCGLCHRRVLRRFRYPHPEAATLDHIVPITKGGEHTPANVQLAHAKCNLLKGNRKGCGSQLRLA
jgi:5-methylcytosine-specific restriction endonuclease McrA